MLRRPQDVGVSVSWSTIQCRSTIRCFKNRWTGLKTKHMVLTGGFSRMNAEVCRSMLKFFIALHFMIQQDYIPEYMTKDKFFKTEAFTGTLSYWASIWFPEAQTGSSCLCDNDFGHWQRKYVRILNTMIVFDWMCLCPATSDVTLKCSVYSLHCKKNTKMLLEFGRWTKDGIILL